MRPVRTTARGLLSAIFVVSGARAVTNPEQLVPQAKPVTDRIAPLLAKTHPRLPTETRALVRLNGAAQLAGGLMLATGRGARPAAAMLAVSLVPTTAASHPFWAADDPVQRRTQAVHFLKNLGLLGGLLLAAVDTQGRPGLRWRTGRLVDDARRSAKRAARSARQEARQQARAARIAKRAARAGHLAGRRLPG